MNDTEILDWMERVRVDVYYDEGSPCSIEYVINEICRVDGQSLRYCVIKANEDK